MSTVILEPKKINSVNCFYFSPSICHDVTGQDVMSLFFECWVLSQHIHSALSPSSRGSLVPLHFLPLGWYHLHIWGYWYFLSNLDSRLMERIKQKQISRIQGSVGTADEALFLHSPCWQWVFGVHQTLPAFEEPIGWEERKIR